MRNTPKSKDKPTPRGRSRARGRDTSSSSEASTPDGRRDPVSRSAGNRVPGPSSSSTSQQYRQGRGSSSHRSGRDMSISSNHQGTSHAPARVSGRSTSRAAQNSHSRSFNYGQGGSGGNARNSRQPYTSPDRRVTRSRSTFVADESSRSYGNSSRQHIAPDRRVTHDRSSFAADGSIRGHRSSSRHAADSRHSSTHHHLRASRTSAASSSNTSYQQSVSNRSGNERTSRHYQSDNHSTRSRSSAPMANSSRGPSELRGSTSSQQGTHTSRQTRGRDVSQSYPSDFRRQHQRRASQTPAASSNNTTNQNERMSRQYQNTDDTRLTRSRSLAAMANSSRGPTGLRGSTSSQQGTHTAQTRGRNGFQALLSNPLNVRRNPSRNTENVRTGLGSLKIGESIKRKEPGSKSVRFEGLEAKRQRYSNSSPPQASRILIPNWYLTRCLKHEYDKNQAALTFSHANLMRNWIRMSQDQGLSHENRFHIDKEYDDLAEKLAHAAIFYATKAKGTKPKPHIPILLFTTPLKVDVTMSGDEIVKLARQWATTGNNLVYTSEDFAYEARNVGRSQEPHTFFKSKGFDDTPVANVLKPLPIVTLDANDPRLEEKALKQGVCLIRGYEKIINDFAPKAFDMKTLQTDFKDQKLDLMRQRPHNAAQNLKFDGTPGGWIVDGIFEENTLDVFINNYQLILKTIKEGYLEFKNSHIDDHPEIMFNLKKSLIRVQLDCDQIRDPTFPVITFGTNLDVSSGKLQNKAVEILPEFARPNERMMKFIRKIIPGINGVQVYLKGPGGKTSGHYENLVIGSVNFNFGPGECVWFTISMLHAARFEKLMCFNGVYPYHTKLWPDEATLKKEGIPYRKFTQKAGDMVFINIGTYHWVQANDFCNNIAWNVMQFEAKQLFASALFHDHYTMHRYNIVLPFESMLWQTVAQAKKEGADFKDALRKLLIPSLAHCQFEVDYVNQRHLPIRAIRGSAYDFSGAIQCYRNGCKRDWLFNMVCVQEREGEADRPLCVECLQENTKGVKCYQRYTIAQLIKMFDSLA